jgi:hypothetical protein
MNRLWKFIFSFFICLCLLLSSGRLGSLDASTQMQASLLLARTGNLGTAIPPKGELNWVQSPNGNYYQVHDIGATIVMLPASFLGSITSKANTQDLIDAPPIITRLGVSLTYACVGAIGCTFMYLTFANIYSKRSAFFLSLAMPFATIYGAYTKSTWDVLGAACAVCALLYFSSKLLQGEHPSKNSLLMTLSFLISTYFRYSLAPFLIIGIAGSFYFSRSYLTWKNYLSCLSLLCLGMLPNFIYNYVRMGNPLRPATTAPIYLNGNNALGGNIVHGLLELIFSPNGGILIFSPIIILVFFLPIVWKNLALLNRQLILSYSISACLYIFLIAYLKQPISFGWGPRYLMPILPILFFIAATVLKQIWDKYVWGMVFLLCLSVAVSVPPIFVNWDLVTATLPNTASRSFTSPPQQILGTWRAVMLGLQGQLLPTSPEISNDPARRGAARFPDIWWVRLTEQSQIGFVAGIVIALILLASLLFCLFTVLQGQTELST